MQGEEGGQGGPPRAAGRSAIVMRRRRATARKRTANGKTRRRRAKSADARATAAEKLVRHAATVATEQTRLRGPAEPRGGGVKKPQVVPPMLRGQNGERSESGKEHRGVKARKSERRRRSPAPPPPSEPNAARDAEAAKAPISHQPALRLAKGGRHGETATPRAGRLRRRAGSRKTATAGQAGQAAKRVVSEAEGGKLRLLPMLKLARSLGAAAHQQHLERRRSLSRALRLCPAAAAPQSARWASSALPSRCRKMPPLPPWLWPKLLRRAPLPPQQWMRRQRSKTGCPTLTPRC